MIRLRGSVRLHVRMHRILLIWSVISVSWCVLLDIFLIPIITCVRPSAVLAMPIPKKGLVLQLAQPPTPAGSTPPPQLTNVSSNALPPSTATTESVPQPAQLPATMPTTPLTNA